MEIIGSYTVSHPNPKRKKSGCYTNFHINPQGTPAYPNASSLSRKVKGKWDTHPRFDNVLNRK